MADDPFEPTRIHEREFHMRMSRERMAVLAGAASLGASVVLAQPTTTLPPAPPMERERGNDPVQPAQPIPGQTLPPTIHPPRSTDLPQGEPALPTGSHLAEGTFLSKQPGKLLRARTGDVIFIPAALADGRELPAMVLLPSQRLGQIETAMGAPGFSGSATLGGQVFVYRTREYLLPTTFAQQAAAPAKEQEPAPKPATPNQPKPADALDPRAEDLIKELESQRSTPRALDPLAPAPKDAPPQPEGDPRSLVQEGTFMTFKRGRLIRLPDLGGRIAFAFDNDPNSPAPSPMIIQPCGQLERLESLVAAQGDALAIKMSGRVMTFRGRNYLLPTLAQATRSVEVVPMQ